MNKEETDLIIAEQNKSTEEILKAVAKVKADYHELCKLKDMRIAELEAQIEKMKNCDNCKHDCKLVIAHFGGCDFLGKKEKWEMKEK